MSPLVLLLIAVDAWIAPGPASATTSPTAEARPAGDTMEKRLTALEIALSTTITQPPEHWRFDRLRAESRAIVADASREADRAAAREIGRRIDRFTAIADRNARVSEVDGWRRPTGQAAPGERLAPPVRLTKAPARSETAAAPDSRPAHDAVGILRPVVSKRPGAPKYGVINDKGRLVALVTPAPGVAGRFEALLGRRVGLDGKRGYLTDLHREHLTAERVTALPTRRR